MHQAIHTHRPPADWLCTIQWRVSPIFNLLPSPSSIIKWCSQTKMLPFFLLCTVVWSSISNGVWIERNQGCGFSSPSQKNGPCRRNDSEDAEQGLILGLPQKCLCYHSDRFAVFTIKKTASYCRMGIWQSYIKGLLLRLMENIQELFQMFVRGQALHAVRSQTIFA